MTFTTIVLGYDGSTYAIDALETAQSSRVYDRNGTLITELRGEQNRTDVGI